MTLIVNTTAKATQTTIIEHYYMMPSLKLQVDNCGINIHVTVKATQMLCALLYQLVKFSHCF